MTKVFATNEPGKELDVTDAELTDLRRLGLLVEDETPNADKKPADKNKETN